MRECYKNSKFIELTMYFFIYLLIHSLSIAYPPFNSSIHLSTHQSTLQPTHPSFTPPSIFQPIHPSFNTPIHLFIHHFTNLFIHLSTHSPMNACRVHANITADEKFNHSPFQCRLFFEGDNEEAAINTNLPLYTEACPFNIFVLRQSPLSL